MYSIWPHRPDGRWLASGSADRTCRLWDLRADDPSLSPRILRGHKGAVGAVHFSPDNRWLLSKSDGDEGLRLWDCQADESSRELPVRGKFNRMANSSFSFDSRWLGAATSTAIHLWDLQERDIPSSRKTFTGLGGNTSEYRGSLAFTPDSKSFATIDGDTVAIRKLGGDEVTRLSMDGWIRCIGVSPNGRWLVAGSEAGEVRLWDLTRSNLANTRSSYRYEIPARCSFLSRGSRWLALGHEDNTIRVFDLRDWKAPTPQLLQGFEHEVGLVAISQSGRFVVAGEGPSGRFTTDPPEVRVWDLHARESVGTSCLLPGSGWVTSMGRDQSRRPPSLYCAIEGSAAPLVPMGAI